jgi:hypothetical protein
LNYFKVLGLVFGLAALLKPVYMHLLPWDENRFIAKAYGEKRPAWIVPMALLGLGLIALTWYMHFTAGVPNSIVLAVIFSLTAVKAIALIFDYKTFHRWVARMLAKEKGRDIVLIDIAAGVTGLVILVLTFLLY